MKVLAPKKLAKILIDMNMSQTELAEKADTSVSYLNNIIKGKQNPSLGWALRIANVLGMTVDNVFFEERGDSYDCPQRTDEGTIRP